MLDVNDRMLRNVIIGLGSPVDGNPRQTGFDITAASEVMAIFALARSVREMRERFGRVGVGYTDDGDPVTAEDIGGAGAMTVIMREALKPNLLQTLENTPVLVHAGPFGNIAHGNSSVVADLIGIHSGDYLITEAGFGADMGAERLFNIKCRASELTPDAAVVVATVRALKAHSGRFKIVAGKPLPPELHAHHAGPRRDPCRAFHRHRRERRDHGAVVTGAFGRHTVDDFFAAVASREPAPGGGAVAAVTVAAAAGLVAMAARFSADLPDAGAVVAEANGLRHRVVGLADSDAVAYGKVLAAYRAPAGVGRGERIREALREATEVPARITAAGARAAELGGWSPGTVIRT